MLRNIDRKILSYTGTVLLLGGAISFTSCVKDNLAVENPSTYLSNDKARIKLYTDAADFYNPVTRADDSKFLPPMVLVFEGIGASAIFSEAAQSELNSSGETVVVLTKTDVPSTLLLIANAPEDKFLHGTTEVAFTAENIADALTSTDSNPNKTPADVENTLFTIPLATGTANVTTAPFGGNTFLPVSGIKEMDKIEDGATISGDGGNPLALTRAVAKATVTVEASATGFTLEGVGAVKAARNGSLYRYSSTIRDNTDPTNYLNGSGNEVAMLGVANNSTTNDPLFLYESRNTLGTCLIIKGKYNNTSYYYKLAFLNDKTPLDILRNKNYSFKITGVKAGYSTLQQAIDGTADNLEYEVKVLNASGHEIISNGDYYLSVSNSEVIIYGNQSTLSGAFTVTTDASNFGITSGSITYNTTGGSGTITGSAFAVPASNGAADITVTMPATVTSGTAIITVGTLSLRVSFERKAALHVSGFLELPGGDYASCEIDGTVSWLKISTDGINPITSNVTLPQASDLFILAEHNVNLSTPTVERSGGELTTSRMISGRGLTRTKVYISQEGFQQNFDMIPQGYIGAFWKHNQTGERLIRFKQSLNTGTTLAGEWTATVISGADWIKLDTGTGTVTGTNDPGVTYSSNLEYPADMNNLQNDTQYSVGGNAITVTGNCTGEIFFRIGLKNTLDSETSQPRYGLVLLSYNSNTKNHLIFIRQGEAADYLMRPHDPATNWNGSRSRAGKFSPYNLTSPEFLLSAGAGQKKGGNTITDHSQLDINGGVFTEYPSQVGAYFQWANEINFRYAYHPSNPNDRNGITGFQSNYPPNSTYWGMLESMHETCPKGYRRATDGTTSEALTVASMIPDNSEVRQSLWLYPPSGSDYETQNIVWGYYADGFFDRWATVPSSSYAVDANTAVCMDINDYRVAYIGALFYNPYNAASLFFPATGYREHDVGSYFASNGRGGYYYFGSSTNSVGGSYLFLYFQSDIYARAYTMTKSAASAIRCIAE